MADSKELVNESIRFNFQTKCDELLVQGEWVSLDAKTMTMDDMVDTYAAALKAGYKGTENEWVDRLTEHARMSEYTPFELAALQGYIGTEQEFQSALQSEDPYAHVVAMGYEGDEDDFLDSVYELAELTPAELEEEFFGVQPVPPPRSRVRTCLVVIAMLVISFIAYRVYTDVQKRPLPPTDLKIVPLESLPPKP